MTTKFSIWDNVFFKSWTSLSHWVITGVRSSKEHNSNVDTNAYDVVTYYQIHWSTKDESVCNGRTINENACYSTFEDLLDSLKDG